MAKMAHVIDISPQQKTKRFLKLRSFKNLIKIKQKLITMKLNLKVK